MAVNLGDHSVVPAPPNTPLDTGNPDWATRESNAGKTVQARVRAANHSLTHDFRLKDLSEEERVSHVLKRVTLPPMLHLPDPNKFSDRGFCLGFRDLWWDRFELLKEPKRRAAEANQTVRDIQQQTAVEIGFWCEWYRRRFPALASYRFLAGMMYERYEIQVSYETLRRWTSVITEPTVAECLAKIKEAGSIAKRTKQIREEAMSRREREKVRAAEEREALAAIELRELGYSAVQTLAAVKAVKCPTCAQRVIEASVVAS